MLKCIEPERCCNHCLRYTEAQSIPEALRRLIAGTTAGLPQRWQKVASVSVETVPPDKKSSPKVAQNTALSAVAGLMLVVFWAFLQN
jgi:capsular polysaccharide biosynthesis protein